MSMYEKLTPAEKASTPKDVKPTRRPIVPVPTDAPALQFKHPEYGPPSKTWPYHDASGQLVGYVGRFETEGGKDFMPLMYCDLGNGRQAWRAKGFPEPRPLYNLHTISASAAATIIICEGEKAADAAQILFPDYVATTPPHGAKSPKKADWTALEGRNVIISTDNDVAGQSFGDLVFELASNAGAESILELQPSRLGRWRFEGDEKILQDVPDKYDLADALADGWTAEAIKEIIDTDEAFFSSYSDAAAREAMQRKERGEAEPLDKWPFRLLTTGVEKRIEKENKETGEIEIEWKWFCSYLQVTAETRDCNNQDWGRLLTIVDRDEIEKTWAMPMKMLAADGAGYREELLSLGLTMAPGKFAKDCLHQYISMSMPREKARCVNRVGWTGNAFVMPTHTLGAL